MTGSEIAASAIVISEAMPSQLEGMIGNRPFYFRGRWSKWELRIGPEGGNSMSAVGGEVVTKGCDVHAGWWSEDEAREALAKAIDGYLKEEA